MSFVFYNDPPIEIYLYQNYRLREENYNFVVENVVWVTITL